MQFMFTVRPIPAWKILPGLLPIILLTEKSSGLLQIPVKNLLDDYNLFLYQNFGMQLRNLRTSFHLKQYELAELLNVNKSAVLSWEHEWHIMPYETYHLLFQTDFLKQHCNS